MSDTLGLGLDGFVPGAPNGSDQVGALELAAELRDVDVDRSRAARVVIAPHALEESIAGEDGAAVRDQVR